MKSAKAKCTRQRPLPLYASFYSPTVLEAIARLQRVFPIVGPMCDLPLHLKKQYLVERLVVLALAHIEVISPRFQQMIDYCEAEQLDQSDYLESLIRVKFRKNLHRIDRDDDDDGGSPVEPPRPTAPKSSA